MGVTVLVFAIELQEVRTKCIFLRFLREDWGEFQNVMYVKGGRKYLKKLIRFYRTYIEISHLGPSVIKKAILNENQSKNKFNIHYRGSP